MALAMLGIPLITSFEEENNNAKLCKMFFEPLRNQVLRDHTWSFARAEYDLQKLDQEFVNPAYPIRCAMPYDLIRCVGLSSGNPFQKFGREIHVKELPEKLLYIRKVEDTESFDPTFVEALKFLLASEIGLSNTRDLNLVNYYRQQYQISLATARSIDSQENAASFGITPVKSTFIGARFNGQQTRIQSTGKPIVWANEPEE